MSVLYKRIFAKCKNCKNCVHKSFETASGNVDSYQCKIPFNGEFVYLDKNPEDFCSDFNKR